MSDRSLPRITLVSSNGRGLGHLSREIAITLAIGDRAEVTMFTFSRGLHLASRFGVEGEFCPGPASAWLPWERWDEYVNKRFELFLNEVRPDVVLFDGVAPYLGVINALRGRPSISAGWLRRGMWLKGPNNNQLEKTTAFDFVIEPGDLASAADRGPTSSLEAIRVPPVSLLEVVPPLGRNEASEALGLDPNRQTLLFALGPDRPIAGTDVRHAALERVLRHADWQVGIVTSPLAERKDEGLERGVALNGVYPLASHLSAFDAAISAAGYNSVHELIASRMPTLFIPNSTTGTDNQVARAKFLADRRLALVAPDDNANAVQRQVEYLLRKGTGDLRKNLEASTDIQVIGGATEVASILTSAPPVGIRQTGTGEWRQPGIRGFAKRAIGPAGVERVRRVLRRSPLHPRGRRVSLEPDHADTHLLITDDPADVARSEHQPVEHILEGASSSYRQARRNLIDEFYDLLG